MTYRVELTAALCAIFPSYTSVLGQNYPSKRHGGLTHLRKPSSALKSTQTEPH